jgi:hypothetical protein
LLCGVCVTKDSTEYVNELASEAAAFNQRISERRAIGFVPDIRRAVKSDYFYKSFWRGQSPLDNSADGDQILSYTEAGIHDTRAPPQFPSFTTDY